MFEGRKLFIATKHKKEQVITKHLEKGLKVKCEVKDDYDTDSFGTFTGEIERELSPLETVRNKCLRGMEKYGYDLGVASEGSFGPHPAIYFAPADDEFLIFIDKKNNLEIIVRELSTETNFSGSEITTENRLFEFATNVNFPSHGLILRKSKDENVDVKKGINNHQQLQTTFNNLIQKYGTAYIETDMRAMYNPTRMKIIEKAAKKLVEKINACCPVCKMPGFGITDAKKGLPCELCNTPTKGTICYIYSCQQCSFQKEEKYPNGKKTEDPMYCDICNP
jgi:hypothetical protein